MNHISTKIIKEAFNKYIISFLTNRESPQKKNPSLKFQSKKTVAKKKGI